MEKIILYLNMDGYSFYVWSSYGLWFFLLLLLITKILHRKRKIEKKLVNLNIND